MEVVSSDSEVWMQGYDENGVPFWLHKTTREISFYQPTLTVPRTYKGVEPRKPRVEVLNRYCLPASESGAKRSQAPTREAYSWSVHKDHMNRTFYFNCVTGARVHEKPDCLKKYRAT